MTMRAAYVPVLAVKKTVNFAGDYSYRRREMTGRFGETVDTIAQTVDRGWQIVALDKNDRSDGAAVE